jgi:hypothetical protein
MNRAFTHGFSTFLRRRRATWYFERRPLLGGLTAALKLAPPQGARVPPGLGEDLLAAAREELQNFGAMDILCTDKTGTLTQDKIALARHADVYGADTDEVLNFAFHNSYYQTGLKNLLDHAVLEHVELPAELKLKDAYRKVDEVPFDFERRRMSVVVAAVSAGQDLHHELEQQLRQRAERADRQRRPAVPADAASAIAGAEPAVRQRPDRHPVRQRRPRTGDPAAEVEPGRHRPVLPFVQSRAAAPLIGMTLAIMAVGLWLPIGPLAGCFRLQALPSAYYGWLVAILLGYCTLTTLMKRIYIRRYGWQ